MKWYWIVLIIAILAIIAYFVFFNKKKTEQQQKQELINRIFSEGKNGDASESFFQNQSIAFLNGVLSGSIR